MYARHIHHLIHACLDLASVNTCAWFFQAIGAISFAPNRLAPLRGFVNLGLLFLFVSSFRIAAENIRDHGIVGDAYAFIVP